MIEVVRFFRSGFAVGLIATSLLMFANANAEERLAYPCSLVWEPSESTEVVGYAVYYGSDTAIPASREDVGPSTTVTFTNLLAESEYYFYVVAYNEIGMESVPSETVYYTPGAMTPVSLNVLPEGGMELFFRAAPGTNCRVEFSPSLDVPDWQPLSEIIADEAGNVRLMEPVLEEPARFYRAVLL